MFELSELEMVLRLLAALGLGCVVGFEREVRNRSAGMRTHALAAEGAALFAMAAILVSEEAAKAGYGPSDRGELSRRLFRELDFSPRE